MEFVEHINYLDDDCLLYTIFGNMQTLQEHNCIQMHSFYTISADLISQTITLVNYIDLFLDS